MTQLPELPEPNSYCTHADSHEYDVFDADQMRAYAELAIASGKREPLSDAKIIEICESEGLGKCLGLAVARAIEQAHGITGNSNISAKEAK